MKIFHALLVLTLAASASASGAEPSAEALAAAGHALATYEDEIIETLAELVRFRTVATPGVPNAENPEFRKLTGYLRAKAEELGLDFQDHGAVVIVGLGESDDRVGVITHADVQPADPSKWRRSPFELDRESEPGRLIARGSEDDKGPIAIALYAMKALAEQGHPLRRRLELIVSYTEESDWTPMTDFLQSFEPPRLNIALDSRFPVVTAEKGWCLVQLQFPATEPPRGEGPLLSGVRGGSFVSQVPEDALAHIENASADLVAGLWERAQRHPAVEYSFTPRAGALEVRARGKAAHSSEPQEGVNAITHLAELLGGLELGATAPALAVDFLNRYVGTGHHAELFGDVAFRHPFMGPLTLAATTLSEQDGTLVLSLNLRRPAGKSTAQLESEIRELVDAWKQKRGLESVGLNLLLGEPHLIEDAPHVPVLLGVYAHFTGDREAAALSAGGGTHARLFPNGVSFGPHMPHRAYTGHTEHEYLSLEELRLDIQMYTAMMAELAWGGDD